MMEQFRFKPWAELVQNVTEREVSMVFTRTSRAKFIMVTGFIEFKNLNFDL
jgi:hypothetical protein